MTMPNPPGGPNFGPGANFPPFQPGPTVSSSYPPPPPGWRPPSMFFPPPPPRRGIWRIMLVIILLLLLGLSVLLNVAQLAAHGGALASQQQVIQEGDAATEIAIVPLEQEINQSVYEKFNRNLSRVASDENVKALVVRIGTPGGEVTASDEIYQSLLNFKASKQIPIVISMGGMATSGGYYASCAGDYLFAEQTTFTGNIGVLMPRFNLSKLADKYGIEENTIVSTGAIYKNAGSMFQPTNARDEAYLQNLIDSAFVRFKSVVTTGRAKMLKKPIDQIADGRVYTAQRALEEGLVDNIGYLQDAWQYAATAAHVSKPQVVRFDEKQSLFSLLGGDDSASFHLHPLSDSNSPDAQISVDSKTLQQWLRPRLLYQWMP